MSLKTPIIGTGLSGLVGSKVLDTNQDLYEFRNLDLNDPQLPVDITNSEQVLQALSSSNAECVLHFAAFTDVTKAWEQKDDRQGVAYQVNVVGTENIVRACEATNKHLIHISTAYVFDGEKTEPYLESDAVKPIEWYGTTKALAEECVMNGNNPWTILRIDQPFRSDPFPKKDIAHRIIAGLESGTLPPLFTDHFFGPTFIDDFAKVISWVISNRTTGLYHASSGEMWNDYDFGTALKNALQLSGEIEQGSLENYLKTLQRPYQKNTALDCTKLLSQLSFKATPINQALASITT